MKKIYSAGAANCKRNFIAFLAVLFCLTINETGIAQTQTFTYTGSNQTFVVPAGVTSVTVKLWGAGGGGNGDGPSSGGSGAFVKGTLSVTPGQSLVIVVGGGGSYSNSAVIAGGFGGGGNSGGASGGSGAGYSGIFNTSISFANTLTIAGGGAGGGYFNSSTYGGAGGATTGSNGGDQAATWTGGKGGSTTAGGPGGGVQNANGTAGGNGTAGQGGNGGNNVYSGGGGGGGYFGGGGGYGSNTSNRYSSGGGGGASYLGTMTGTTNTAGLTSTAATGTQAPGSAETGYLAGVGNGGSSSTIAGGNGLVIITYSIPSPTITSFTPTSGCANTISVVITGTNFTGATAVKFGGTAAASFTVNSATQITATPAAGATGTIAVTTPNGTGTSGTSFTVNALPVASIIYSGSPFCSTSGTATLTQTGQSGGTYSSTAGLSINSATGDVNLGASTAGTYTVTYSFTNGTCSKTTTASITITTAPSASISYAGTPFCSNSAAGTVTRTGTAGGTYSAPAGLTISATTGAITPSSSTPSTYLVTYTVGASGGCAIYTTSTSVTVNPRPVAGTITGATGTCIGSNTTLTANPTGVSPFTFTWNSSNTAVATVDNSGVVTGVSAGTTNITYTVTDANGCVQTSAAFVFGVTPTAGAITGTANACVAGTVNLVSHATGVGALSYVWNSSNPLIATVDNSGLVTAAAPGTTNITYTVTDANTCSATSATFTFTVNATPSIVTTQATSACSATAFSVTPANTGGNIIPAGTTYSWGLPTVTGGMTGGATATNATSISGTLTNATTSVQTATYTVTATSVSCTSTPFTVTVTVNPKPVLTSGLTAPGICNNTTFSYTPTSTTSGTTFSWTRAAIAGNAAAAGTDNPNEILVNNTTAPVSVTYIYTLSANLCSNTQNVVVTVNPTPVLNSGLTAAPRCNNVATTYTSTSPTSGTTYTWSRAIVAGISNAAGSGSTAAITETLVNTTTAPVTVTYSITLTANGCSNTQSVNVTINPTPVLTSSLTPPARCSNVSTTYTATSATNPATFSWTRATVTGISNAAGSGSTATITETFINTTANPVNVTYVVTTTANGCSNAQNVIVTINPNPTLNSSLTATRCNNIATTYTATSATTGITFSWTRATVANISNAAGSGSTPSATETLVNTSTAPVNVIYVYILTANGCSNTQNVTVTVYPTPILTSSLTPPARCSGIAGTYTASSATSSTYTWTRAVVPGISNGAGSGSSGTITETLVNTTAAPIDITYVIVQSANGCSNTQNVIITINPKPITSAISGPTTVCIGNMITLTSTGSGIGTLTYAWTSSNITTATVTNAGVVLGKAVGATTITYTVTDANGCTSAASPGFTVTVTKPTANAITQASGITSICSNATLQLTSNAAGTGTLTYTWASSNNAAATVNNSGLVTGVSSGTTNITYTVTDANGCSTTSANYTVTLTAIPSGIFTSTETSNIPNDNIICAGAPIKFTAPAGYAAYDFRINGNPIAAQSGTSNVFTTTTLTNGASVTVDVSNTLNCGATFGPTVITVTPAPVPTLIASKTTICPGEQIMFTAGGGTSYTFSVNGSAVQSGTSNIYTNSTLANGQDVSVTVMNANTCTATSTPIIINVNPVPSGTLTAAENSGTPNNNIICAGANVTFTATGGTSYQFSINGSIVQAFSAVATYSSTTLANASIVSVAVTNGAGCTATYTPVVITVNALPTGNINVTENSGTVNDNSICANASVTFTATAGSGNTYQFYLNSAGAALQSGASNTYTTTTLTNGDLITVIVTNSNGCTATYTSATITVVPSPTGTLTVSPASICANDNVTITATAGFTNYNFKVNGITVQNGASNIFSSTTFANGDVTTADVTNSNSCVTTFGPVTLTIAPAPTTVLVAVENSGTTNNDGITCSGATIVFTAGTGFTNYNFLLNNVSVQNSASNTYSNSTLVTGDKVTVAITNAGGCIGLSNNIVVTVNPLPVVGVISGTSAVCINSSITLTNPTAGGAWSSANTGIATVDASGNVTGVSTGTVNINYTVTNSTTGCSSIATKSITVNPLPVVAAITGTTSVCVSSTTQLADATTGGVWTSSNTTVATVDASGLVSGLAAGTSLITYTLTNGNGCTNAVSKTVTVNALPVVAPITGTFSVCVGDTKQLSNTTPGGNWSSSDPSVATIGLTGFVTGVAAGTTTISYSITTNNCTTTVTQLVTVNALPVPTLTGPNPICLGSIGNVYTTEAGQTNYSWNIVNGTVTAGGTSTDNTVTVSWLSAGPKSISVNYTDGNGCAGATSATVVNAPGSSPVITGPAVVCNNSTGNVYSTQAGNIDYEWTVSGGTITSGGGLTDETATVTWNTAGVHSITVNYAAPGGCSAATPTTYNVTVRPLPTAAISGTVPVCQNSTAPVVTFTGAGSTAPYTFTYTINGGTNLTVVSSGNTATVAVPTTTAGSFTYDLVSVQDGSSTSCAQAQTGSATVTVRATPSATIAYSGSPFCTSSGTVNVLLTGTTGGTFSAPGGLSINSTTGVITPAGSTAGTYTITYTVAAAGGCTVFSTTTSVTVTAAPSATIAYTTPTCTNAGTISVTRTGSAGGTYSYTGAGTLSIDPSTGAITAGTSTAGTYTVVYTIAAANGCGQFTTTAPVTITAAPSATIVYATPVVCAGSGNINVTLTGTTGGTYSSTPVLVINANGRINTNTSTPGVYTVTYTVAASGGCAQFTTTAPFTINPIPSATIAGTATVCQNGVSPVITFTGSNGTAPYTFTYQINGGGTANIISSGNTATINAPTGIASSFVYTLVSVKDASTTTCSAAIGTTATVTVNAAPAPFVITPTGPLNICQGTIQPLTATATASSTGSLTISSGNINLSIPDATFFGLIPGSVTNPLAVSTVPAGAVINSMSIAFNINHTYDGDLVLNLKAPNGKVLNLVDQRGNSGDNFTNTVVSSTSVNPFLNGAGNAPFTGTFVADADNGVGTPNSGNNIFSDLFSTPNGTWIFGAEDDAGGDVGTILNWSLTFNYTIPNSPLPVVWSPATDLYTDAGATTPYTGTSVSTVYAKPLTTGSKVYTATASNGAGCSTGKTVTLIVGLTPVVTVTADYCAVAGKVQLTANSTPAATSYLWNTGGTTQTILVDVAGIYTVTVYASGSTCPGKGTINVANELVKNGNFEAGNVAFTSAYPYRTGAGSLNNPPGYAVDTAANFYGPTFLWGKDHTTTHGKFMMVNGAAGANYQIWQQTLNVLPNTTYYFSAWGLELDNLPNNPNPPYGPPANALLQFNVGGTQVGTQGNLPRPVNPTRDQDNNGWVRFYGTWTSGPTTTSVVVSITDLQGAVYGNNFGLDDISFSTLSTFVNLISPAGTDAQTVCAKSAIQDIVYSAGSSASAPTVTGLPAGVTTSWNGVFLTINGAPTTPGNYSYTVTTTGGCLPATATGTITVQGQKIALSSGSSAPVICAGSTPSINIGYTITGTATGIASLSGLPATVTGSLSGSVYTITGSIATAGSYPYKIITSGTGCIPDTARGTITVQTPSIILSSAPGSNVQTVCINTPITTIQYTVSGTATGAGVTGLPSGLNMQFIGGLFVISGSPTQSGTFNYTVTTTGGSCALASATGTINVTPAATLVLTSAAGTNNQLACNNGNITPITYALTNATGATVSGLPAGVTGAYSAGIFTITGSPSPAVTGAYNYTVTANGGCGSAIATGTITFQSQTITLTSGSASPAVCIGTPITNIVYTIGGTATGATVSSLPAGITGTLSGNIFTISGTPTVGAITSTYTITTSGSCGVVTASGTITISPAAVGGTVSSVSICSGASGTLTLIGQVGTIIRWESSTDNFSTVITPIVNTTITQAYSNVTVPTQYRVVIGNTCGNVYSSVATVGIHNYWSGGNSSDWYDASNWSDNLIPSNTCPMVYVIGIKPHQPIISTGVTAIQNITISGGGLLTVTGATLKVSGNITSTNGIDASNGTIELNGAAAQSISGDYFANKKIKNLTISNNVNVTGSDTLKIAGELGFSAATASKTFAAGNSNVSLLSSFTLTANVAELKNGNSITGTNFTVERYINTGTPATTPGTHNKSWQLLSTPTNGQTINQAWQENQTANANGTHGYGTQITAPNYTATNGFDAVTPGPSLKKYNSLTDNYDAVTSTTGIFNDPLGYYLYVRGDRSVTSANAAPANATVLRSTGSLITGTQAAITIPANRYGTVGNPYAAPLDLVKMHENGGFVNTTNDLYLWDPSLGGSYGAGGFVTLTWIDASHGYRLNAFGSVNYPTAYVSTIQSGQAFFVKSNNVGTTLVKFTESAKATQDSIRNVNGINSPVEILTATLTNSPAGSSKPVVVDGTLAIFGEDYSNNVDWNDGIKIPNGTNNVGFMRQGRLLVVERRQSPVAGDTLHLNLSAATKNVPYHWQFSAEHMDNIPGRTAYLWDRYLDTKTIISLNGTTDVDFTVTAAGISAAADRFKIVFSVSKALPVTLVSVKAKRNTDKTISVTWQTANEVNLQNFTVERSSDATSFTGLGNQAPANNNGGGSSYVYADNAPLAADNYYRIKAVSKDGSIQYSPVVKVAALDVPSSISVYPNPVVNREMNISFVNEPKGTYTLELVSKLGQVLYRGKVNVSAAIEKKKVSLVNVTAGGIYRLIIHGEDGSVNEVDLLINNE